MPELDLGTQKLLIDTILRSYNNEPLDSHCAAMLFHWMRNRDLPMYNFVKEYFGRKYNKICLGKKLNTKKKEVIDGTV